MNKILLLSEIFPPQHGGSGRWFWEVYSRLPAEKVIVAAGAYPGCEEFDQTHELEVVRLPLTTPEWGLFAPGSLHGYWSTRGHISRLVDRYDVEEIHCGRCIPEGWVAFLNRLGSRTPYICYVHGEDVETAGTSRELSWMVRRVLASAKYLIANSHNTASILENNWRVRSDKIRVIHPGVDTKKFVPNPLDPIVRERLGWDHRRVILTVGRLQKRKGQDMMIRALVELHDFFPDTLYAVVGGGEELTSLKDLAVTEGVHDSVLFYGDIDDQTMIEMYQQCDLFVLPNRQVGRDIEGFGMVLLEAQACGKPVVAGQSGGTVETMIPGETGLVVSCNEPASLARAIREMLENDEQRRRFGHAARVWVTQNFDWEIAAQRAFQQFRA